MQFLENRTISETTKTDLENDRDKIFETFTKGEVVECSICLVKLDCDPNTETDTEIQKEDNLQVMLPCKHFLHAECYSKLNKQACPLDRKVFDSKKVLIFPFGLYRQQQTSDLQPVGSVSEEDVQVQQPVSPPPQDQHQEEDVQAQQSVSPPLQEEDMQAQSVLLPRDKPQQNSFLSRLRNFYRSSQVAPGRGGRMRSKRKTHKKRKPRKTHKKKTNHKIKSKSQRRRR